MRHGSSNNRKRSRGGNGGRRGNQRMQVFDSNGPDVRIRGTAHQVADKYMALAKDAASAGDQILAESYLQHAEHYQRIISSFDEDVQPNSQKGKGSHKEQKEKTSNDDLSLPGSILGESVEVKTEIASERTAETAA